MAMARGVVKQGCLQVPSTPGCHGNAPGSNIHPALRIEKRGQKGRSHRIDPFSNYTSKV